MHRLGILGPLALVVLAACSPQSPTGNAPESRAARPLSSSAAISVANQAGSCNAEIGDAAALKLSSRCHALSLKTDSPCDPRNACKVIEAEIDRVCKAGATDANRQACRPDAPGYGSVDQSTDATKP